MSIGTDPKKVDTDGDGSSDYVEVQAGSDPLDPESTAVQHALNVNTAGGGTVTSTPAGIDCGSVCTHSFLENTPVTLSAAAMPGSVFSGWNGGGCSGVGTCDMTMDDDQLVNATFLAEGGDDCSSSPIIVSNTACTTGTTNVSSEDSIVTQGQVRVMPNANVTFRAEEVTLGARFHVLGGSVFTVRAQSLPCP